MTASDAVRTPEQAARQQARLRLDDTLEEIARVTDRTRRARDEVARLTGCEDVSRVLNTTAKRLEAVRKELMQGGYLGTGQERLF
jgi:hypothetical protein